MAKTTAFRIILGLFFTGAVLMTACMGNWTNWGNWNECNATCNGTRTRQRNCNGGCSGESTQTQSCDRANFCKNFTAWGQWSACNSSCGQGEQLRTRTFNGYLNGSLCTGSLSVSRHCVTHCPDVIVSEWSNWTQCNMTCGIGFQERHRNCTIQNPTIKPCNTTIKVEQRSCNLTYNRNDEEFEEWSTWTVCNATCGVNSQKRSRVSKSSNIGLTEEQSRRCEPCLECMCVWTNWSNCSCDNNTRYKTRNCSLTAENHLNCSGTTLQTQNCTPVNCPVNGNFTSWSNWTTCTVSCGGGTQQRNRSCTRPAPKLGGKNCTGPSLETKNCSTFPCPVNGNFTTWSNWSSCSVSCGVGGVQFRNRSCTNPAPAHGGNNCTGNITETRNCTNITYCPVHGNYSAWSNWSSCSHTCGNGTMYRNRTCNSPLPRHGGSNCTGSGPSIETHNCSLVECPINGNFTAWSNWSSCSVSCGVGGVQFRNRSCTKPAPAHDGSNCTGNITETRNCTNITYCPVHGNYSAWSTWSSCSHTCGKGTKYRNRTCNSPMPRHGGSNCTGSGPSIETHNCSLVECPKDPVDGNFSPWTTWTKCTATCGGGTQQRMRTCTNPSPSNGGENCTGEWGQTKICNTHFCPIDGQWTAWSSWSKCNKPCGTGEEARRRTCTKPEPRYNGSECLGNSSESKQCVVQSNCPDEKIYVKARFVNETFTKTLDINQSSEWMNLKKKILTNVQKLYVDQTVVKSIEILSFRNGSVVAEFNVDFKQVDSTQLIVLQESLEVKKMLASMPLQTKNITATKVPKAAPAVKFISNVSSTSVNVVWKAINSNDLNGQSLAGYSMFYKEPSEAKYSPSQMKAVGPVDSPFPNATLDGLKKYTDYTMRVLAFTKNGNGISSTPVYFRTEDDVPSRSPANFRLVAINSTALLASWESIPQQYRHGILRGYRMTARNSQTKQFKNFTIAAFQTNAFLIDMDKYTEYIVTICGFTDKGCGINSQKIASTLEDIPTLPPQNVFAFNFTSTNKITIKWHPVPSQGLNGILRHYVLKYQLYSVAHVRDFDADEKTVIVDQTKLRYTIKNARSYARYKVQIAAKNSLGLGPFATIYGETCRCPKQVKTNYWYITPYFNKTESRKASGIFSHIVTNMISWACGSCANGHGSTTVDFDKDGKGLPARKQTILDVAGNVDNPYQISFPINGNKDLDRIYGGQPFIPVVESPGVAYLVIPKLPSSTAMNVLKSVVNTLPFVLFSLGVAYLAGVVIWALDSRYQGSTFPRPFSSGVAEGLWWSFISMTTVGYGDRSPISFLSRCFAIIWTLYGIAIISLLTSTMSSSLTSFTIETQTSIYGAKIAAIQNSSEHRIGILKNGKVNQVNQYHSDTDLYDALVAREVDGALIDTYVVAAKDKMFTDAGIRVAKILDRPFGYGVALSSDIAHIESECLQYLHVNAEQISRLIDSSTRKLTVPPVGASMDQNTRLFDASSELYRNTLMFVCSMLGLAVLCGLLWQFTCHKKNTPKVTPLTAEMLSKTKVNVQHIRGFVDMFYKHMTIAISEMKARHKQEKLKVLEQLYEERKEQRKREKTEAKTKRKKTKTKDNDREREHHLSDLINLFNTSKA